MSEFKVVVERHYSYVVVLKAENAEDAREQVRAFDVEDLEEYERDAWFDYSFAEELDTCLSCEGKGFDGRDEDCGNCEGRGYLE